MLKACSRCGKIHPYNHKCNAGKQWDQYKTETDKLHQTTAWKNKAMEIKERSFHMCAVCADQWQQDPKGNSRITTDNLEVHHIIKLRDNPELLLDDSNLICLCVEHHKKADAGELEADYLKQLALNRDKNY